MIAPTMADRVEEYLAYRRALGYRLRVEGLRLRSFAQYADALGHCGPLSTEVALRWCGPPEQATRRYQARRLELVRGLAGYLAREPGTEVPPRGLLGSSRSRRRAFIYSEADITALIEAARSLAPADGLRPRTYTALVGLLACTGLRITEALTLQDANIDLEAGVLTVSQTKFHKSRLVPRHPSAIEPLRDYAAARGHHRPAPRDTTSFVSDAGRRLPYGTVRSTFHQLLKRAMPGAPSTGRARPRLHDLRHALAVHRLMAWYREGTDIDRAIDRLSAYLGHAKVTDTYWYLTGVPELLALASRRFEQFAAPTQGGTP